MDGATHGPVKKRRIKKEEKKSPTSLVMSVSLGFADVRPELRLKDSFERGQRFDHTVFSMFPGHSQHHMSNHGFQHPD